MAKVDFQILYGVVVRYKQGEKPVLLRETVGPKRDLVGTEYDSTRFGEPPGSCVYLIELPSCTILESSHGEAEIVPSVMSGDIDNDE